MGSGVSTVELMGAKQLAHILTWQCGITFESMDEAKAIEQLVLNHNLSGTMLHGLSIDEIDQVLQSIQIPVKYTHEMAIRVAQNYRRISPQTLQSFTHADVWHEISHMGDQYEDSASKVQDAKVTGQVIYESSADDLHHRLEQVGITDTAQRALIVARLMTIKKAYCESTFELSEKDKELLSQRASSAPRECMQRMFQLQGIPLDPEDLEVAVDRIVGTIGPVTNQSTYLYDCYLSVRKEAEATMAEKVAQHLHARGLACFLPEVGADWRLAMEKSRHVIALLSRKALSDFHDCGRDHSMDILLLEFEKAIQTMDQTKNPAFIIPVLMGEVNENGALIKFRDFNLDQYSPTTYNRIGNTPFKIDLGPLW